MPNGARWPASFPGAGNPDPAPSGLLTKQGRDGAAGPGSRGFLEECPRPARGQVRGRLPCTGEGPLPEGHPLAWGVGAGGGHPLFPVCAKDFKPRHKREGYLLAVQ